MYYTYTMYPDIWLVVMDEVCEAVTDRPVTLLVSENRSPSLSSTAYVPSVEKELLEKLPVLKELM